MPVVPDTQKTDVGGLLEPRVQGCSEQPLHHCTPIWATEWDPQSGQQSGTSTQKKKRKVNGQMARKANS